MTFPPLSFGKVRLIAIDRRARRIDELLNTSFFRSFQHVNLTDDIVLCIKDRHLDASRNASPSRLMQNEIHALTCLFTRRCIFDVALDKSVVRMV